MEPQVIARPDAARRGSWRRRGRSGRLIAAVVAVGVLGLSACGTSRVAKADAAQAANVMLLTSYGLRVGAGGTGPEDVTVTLPSASAYPKGAQVHPVTFYLTCPRTTKGGWRLTLPVLGSFGSSRCDLVSKVYDLPANPDVKNVLVRVEVTIGKGVAWDLGIGAGNFSQVIAKGQGS